MAALFQAPGAPRARAPRAREAAEACTPSAVWLSNRQTPRWRCRWTGGQDRCRSNDTLMRLPLCAAHAYCLQLSRLHPTVPLPSSPVARARMARQALEKGPPLAETPYPRPLQSWRYFPILHLGEPSSSSTSTSCSAIPQALPLFSGRVPLSTGVTLFPSSTTRHSLIRTPSNK